MSMATATTKQPVINLHFLSRLCDGDPKILAQHLMNWGLIPAEGNYPCPECEAKLKLNLDKSRADGLRWQCGAFVRKGHQKRTKCPVTKEFRTGTIFNGMNISMFQCLGLLHLWVSHVPLYFINEQLEITRQTASSWASFCRETVLSAYIMHKQKLGGIGKTVEIHEAKFNRRRFYHGQVVEGQWVFGGYERGGTGRVFMAIVNDQSVDRLIPVIQDWINEGTTIVSDYWKTYNCLSSQVYKNLKANQSLTFSDLDTNKIETSWRSARSKISSSGRRKAQIPGNLARYFFQKRCTELGLNRTEELFRLLGKLHNPLVSTTDLENEECTDISDIEY